MFDITIIRQSFIITVSISYHRVTTLETSGFVCDFQQGDGAGGTEVKIGNLAGNACVSACLHLKQFDNTVNGVTVFADTSRRGCWCERGMRKVLRFESSTFNTLSVKRKSAKSD